MNLLTIVLVTKSMVGKGRVSGVGISDMQGLRVTEHSQWQLERKQRKSLILLSRNGDEIINSQVLKRPMNPCITSELYLASAKQ